MAFKGIGFGAGSFCMRWAFAAVVLGSSWMRVGWIVILGDEDGEAWIEREMDRCTRRV